MKHFLTGLAAGLAVGYLTAPRSGKETRDQLKSTADEKTKGVKDKWNKTVPQVKDLVETVKAKVGMGQSTPNLFAEMESGRMDKYKVDANNQQEAVKADNNN
ncbi:YtxH domain-containing protein [Spirosoma utsteinense]|uniref:Gas vesicle protein n=1 Tax=Spirosoma utsteinense TaxID=2585773 RepID=A0ABR6W825_9BACT|nr:YtxH domain-containing protein [Spirosoma utsteinense]MBC3784173.1 gas vesicle protein [Spirosoma utsteinense]MBC3792738.1 gas vesicle protein [Spirosoma utsteinense]